MPVLVRKSAELRDISASAARRQKHYGLRKQWPGLGALALEHHGVVPSPTLATTSLRLVPLTVEDAHELADVLSDPALYTFIAGDPPTAEALAARIEDWLAGPPRPDETWHNWAIRLGPDGTVIGHLQATVTGAGSTADIAWIVGTPWQGRGYASESALALVRWLETTGLRTITAHVHPDHVASARVAERAGLERTDLVEDGEIVWRRVATTQDN